MDIVLLVIGSLGPLLTFTHLWQVKEWRTDRLREHFRAEGYLRQLFGRTRPAVLLAMWLAAGSGLATLGTASTAALGAYAAITVTQFALRRQPLPVWTKKAIVLTGTALLITTLASLAVMYLTPAWLSALALPVIVLLQPASMAAARLVFQPLDRTLKRRIMQQAQKLRAQHPDLAVVGITGSVGKTTTKELLAHILQDQQPLTTPAHVNSEMGVSQWLIRELSAATEPPRVVIAEMGAYRGGEIATLCQVAQPTIGIVTFIGTQHIALFGSQAALCQAKGELVEAVPESGHAILNADSQLCADLAARAACPVITVGTGGSADLEAFDVEETPAGIRFRTDGQVVTVPLHGTHNVTNVLLGIAAARLLGMDLPAIAQKLSTFSPPERTFTMHTEHGCTVLDDTHNASPASFRAAIAWARNQPASQKTLLTSGLIELGTEQDRTHAELGSNAAAVFDRVIFLTSAQKSAAAFATGYGRDVELLKSDTAPLTAGSLLVCEGRMSETAWRSLLPKEPIKEV